MGKYIYELVSSLVVSAFAVSAACGIILYITLENEDLSSEERYSRLKNSKKLLDRV